MRYSTQMRTPGARRSLGHARSGLTALLSVVLGGTTLAPAMAQSSAGPPGIPPVTNTAPTNNPVSPASPAAGSPQGITTPSPSGTGVPVYDMARTITEAVSSSSDLQIASRNIEIDRKRADEAAAAGRPSLGTSAQATRYDAPTKVQFNPQTPPAELLGTHNEILSINLGERLDLTGQIRAASTQAQLQSLADQFVFDQFRNARILSAKTIYFNLLRAQHQVQVAQFALATAQAQQRLAQQLNAAQVGQKIDVYRATTQTANAEQQLRSAQNNLDIARDNFNDLVGRPLTSPVQVQDVPGVTVGVDISNTSAVGAPAPLAFTPFTVAPAEVSSLDINRSLETAYRSRPEILADQVNVRVAETGIKLARAGLEPTFSINAEGNYYPTTSFQFPRQRTAAITATVTLPLYDGGATRDRVQEARLRTENAQTSLDSAKSDVALNVRQSYSNLLTAARQIDAANTALQQAIAARQLAQVRYEGQVGLYLEVTDAQAALVQAENAQVDAVYNYLIARAQFQNAIGQPQTK